MAITYRIASSCALVIAMTVGIARPATGQTITLNQVQQSRLVELVNSNQDAQSLLKTVVRDADRAMSAQPHPIENIRSEGLLARDPEKLATVNALGDMPHVESLAYAWLATGNTAYGKQAGDYILAWSKKTKPTGNPIDATKLESLFIAYDLTRSGFSAADRKWVDAWLQAIAERQIAERKAAGSMSFNNWNSHRLKIIGLIGFVTGNKQLAQLAVDGFKQQVAADLLPDGSSFDFHERDALHYHVYTLEPLLTLAIAADKNGIPNLYNYTAPNAASLRKSVEFLLPYAEGHKKHAEYVHSKVEFDRKRAAAGQKEFQIGVDYQPTSARDTLALASYFDPRFRPLVAVLAGKPGREYPTWQTLLNAAAGK
ncbi:MAG TPA: alginate lyase family protein [Pirellulales bacterium]|nr:alginate lyase family protein [Pirellulales bacterium]